jgi:hypothetical protein
MRKSGRTNICVICFCFYYCSIIKLHLTFHSVSAAPINLNIKSSFLSRLLKQTDDSQHTNGKKSVVGLDLSGEYDCLLWGGASEDGTKIPLLQRDNSPVLLSLGVHYNIRTIWYGITKGLIRLQYNTTRWSSKTLCSNFLPAILQVVAETSTIPTTQQDSATTIGMQWKNEGSASVRMDTHGKAQLQLQVPVHKRICLISKSNYLLRNHETIAPWSSLGHYNSRIPKQRDWLPDIQLGTSGILSSRHDIAFGRVGLRLTWSRSLGVFGFDTHDAGTTIKLQVSTIDRLGHMCTSLNVDAILEQPRDSLHFTVLHESIHSLSRQ